MKPSTAFLLTFTTMALAKDITKTWGNTLKWEYTTLRTILIYTPEPTGAPWNDADLGGDHDHPFEEESDPPCADCNSFDEDTDLPFDERDAPVDEALGKALSEAGEAMVKAAATEQQTGPIWGAIAWVFGSGNPLQALGLQHA